MPTVFPEAERGKMSAQPVSWKVQLNVFRGGLLKATTEAALITCKTQREEP